jgi:hypothetical protein
MSLRYGLFANGLRVGGAAYSGRVQGAGLVGLGCSNVSLRRGWDGDDGGVRDALMAFARGALQAKHGASRHWRLRAL